MPYVAYDTYKSECNCGLRASCCSCQQILLYKLREICRICTEEEEEEEEIKSLCDCIIYTVILCTTWWNLFFAFNPSLKSSVHLLHGNQGPTLAPGQCRGQGHWQEKLPIIYVWYICLGNPHELQRTCKGRESNRSCCEASVLTAEPTCCWYSGYFRCSGDLAIF